jgi:hypothetical protein
VLSRLAVPYRQRRGERVHLGGHRGRELVSTLLPPERRTGQLRHLAQQLEVLHTEHASRVAGADG